jgi:heptosyltransferase-1
MPAVLFIKTSSLGDVIHQMPAITDARAHLPAEMRLVWVVEEPYAPLARLHPSIDQVIRVNSRRWRLAPVAPATWGEIRTFVRTVRCRDYDAVIDTQGLFRSALIARFAYGPRHGYDGASVRERAASWLYNVTHTVPRDRHAIARNRELTARALGYEVAGPIDFGLSRKRLGGPASGDNAYAILLHATARREKEWPEPHWIELGRALTAGGHAVVLPWGTKAERTRSERLAAEIPGARVPERQPLDQTARLVAGASFVVGVDTGLMHLAAALAVPLVGIFIGTEPGLTGPMGAGPIAIVGGKGAMPTVAEARAALERVG